MSIIDKACNWAISIANDNSHGYSQTIRWGPDYDCSSFVISAFEQAGVAVRSDGNASYTGNMPVAFLKLGFVDVTRQVSLLTGNGLQRGDVLLNVANHTCLYIGNHQVVNCRTDTDGKQGDSKGDEIRIQSYWNYPWDMVLRYAGKEASDPQPATFPIVNVPGAEIVNAPVPETVSEKPVNVLAKSSAKILLQRGMRNNPGVGILQMLLNACGYDLNIDLDYGIKTESTVIDFQRKHNLEVDGIAGNDTLTELIRSLKK